MEYEEAIRNGSHDPQLAALIAIARELQGIREQPGLISARAFIV
jgi:hypothetical protein